MTGSVHFVDDEDLLRLRVVDVAVAVPAGPGVEAGLVTLQEDDPPRRLLRIYVGQPEARAIRVSWRQEVPSRPSTWDLFVSTIGLLGGRVESAILSDVEGGRHFFAHLVIRQGGTDGVGPLLVTARPSDAIAVALRSYGAAIWARRRVIEAAGVDPVEGPGVGGPAGPEPSAETATEAATGTEAATEPVAGSGPH